MWLALLEAGRDIDNLHVCLNTSNGQMAHMLKSPGLAQAPARLARNTPGGFKRSAGTCGAGACAAGMCGATAKVLALSEAHLLDLLFRELQLVHL